MKTATLDDYVIQQAQPEPANVLIMPGPTRRTTRIVSCGQPRPALTGLRPPLLLWPLHLSSAALRHCALAM